MVSKDLRQFLDSLPERRPIPTPEEDQRMGEAIQAGHQAAKRLAELEKMEGSETLPDDYPRLVREVKDTISKGIKAKQELVERHLGLAVYIAGKYNSGTIEPMDLFQTACLALVKAADRWERTDASFATYATAYIRGAVNHCYDRASLVCIPVNTVLAIHKVNKVSTAIKATTGQTVTSEMIAAEMRLPLKLVRDLAATQHRTQMCSLDAPAYNNDEDDSDPLLAFVKAEDDPVKIVTNSIVKEKVAEVLSTLEPTEERVIRFRYGFVDKMPHTQQEVAHACGMTTTEEQLIETAALRRLRHPSRSGQLVGLLS